MRCIMCGKKMMMVKIDGDLCWQCPGKRCRHTVPASPNAEPAQTAGSETGKNK